MIIPIVTNTKFFNVFASLSCLSSRNMMLSLLLITSSYFLESSILCFSEWVVRTVSMLLKCDSRSTFSIRDIWDLNSSIFDCRSIALLSIASSFSFKSVLNCLTTCFSRLVKVSLKSNSVSLETSFLIFVICLSKSSSGLFKFCWKCLIVSLSIDFKDLETSNSVSLAISLLKFVVCSESFLIESLLNFF